MKSDSMKSESTKSARVVPFPARNRRERDEIAFLPAALEIVESPPSPTGRAIGVTIIALFCQAASRLQIANYCLWGHVAEWLRNGLQNRPIRLLHQRPFRKIVEIPPQ
jgi:hypothetical protein